MAHLVEHSHVAFHGIGNFSFCSRFLRGLSDGKILFNDLKIGGRTQGRTHGRTDGRTDRISVPQSCVTQDKNTNEIRGEATASPIDRWANNQLIDTIKLQNHST